MKILHINVEIKSILVDTSMYAVDSLAYPWKESRWNECTELFYYYEAVVGEGSK